MADNRVKKDQYLEHFQNLIEGEISDALWFALRLLSIKQIKELHGIIETRIRKAAKKKG